MDKMIPIRVKEYERMVEEIARLTTSHEAEREHLLFRISELGEENKRLRDLLKKKGVILLT